MPRGDPSGTGQTQSGCVVSRERVAGVWLYPIVSAKEKRWDQRWKLLMVGMGLPWYLVLGHMVWQDAAAVGLYAGRDAANCMSNGGIGAAIGVQPLSMLKCHPLLINVSNPPLKLVAATEGKPLCTAVVGKL